MKNITFIISTFLLYTVVNSQLTYFDNGYPPSPGRRNALRNGRRMSSALILQPETEAIGDDQQTQEPTPAQRPSRNGYGQTPIQQMRDTDTVPRPKPNGISRPKPSFGQMYEDEEVPASEVPQDIVTPDAPSEGPTSDDVQSHITPTEGDAGTTAMIDRPYRNGKRPSNGQRPSNGITQRPINGGKRPTNGAQKPTNGGQRPQRPLPPAPPAPVDDGGDHGDDGGDHHGSSDPIDWLRAAIRGEPGMDYPIYAVPPQTSFKCTDQQNPGYYADVDAQCQVFHICQANGRSDAFLCPNGTIFSQKNFVCVWWFDFDCSTATQFYDLNAQLYKDTGIKTVDGGDGGGGYDSGASQRPQIIDYGGVTSVTESDDARPHAPVVTPQEPVDGGFEPSQYPTMGDVSQEPVSEEAPAEGPAPFEGPAPVEGPAAPVSTTPGNGYSRNGVKGNGFKVELKTGQKTNGNGKTNGVRVNGNGQKPVTPRRNGMAKSNGASKGVYMNGTPVMMINGNGRKKNGAATIPVSPVSSGRAMKDFATPRTNGRANGRMRKNGGGSVKGYETPTAQRYETDDETSNKYRRYRR